MQKQINFCLKRVIRNILLFLSSSLIVSRSTGQVINSAEYFFDKDLGIGKGQLINIPVPGDSVHFASVISTNNLSQGFHSIIIRARNANNIWGISENKVFYFSKTGSGIFKITDAEYFFDKDPGVGNGTKLNIVNSGDSIHLTAIIPITNLPKGFHYLSVRTKNENNIWSICEQKVFFITQSGLGPINISAAEYYIDKDPGITNGVPLSIGATSDSVHFAATVSLGNLNPGIHNIVIRVKNINNIWSIAGSKLFYVWKVGNQISNITNAEYFFDNDPGIGNGVPLTVGMTGDSVHFVAQIPTETLTGFDHKIVIRVKNSNGQWSIYENKKISITASDNDRDGLIDWDEVKYGTDRKIFDTNNDGLADGVNVFTGLNPISTDTDGDGIFNVQENTNGTSPILKDTDGDGFTDDKDVFPNDRFKTTLPVQNLSDHTPPTITLQEPF